MGYFSSPPSSGPTTNPVTVAQGGTGAVTATGARNAFGLFTPTITYDMPKFRRAMAKHINKAGLVKICTWGESHISGEGAGTSTLGLVGANPYSLSATLASILGNRFGTISMDSVIGDQNMPLGGVTYPNYDTRVLFGTGWSSDISASCFGGRFFIAPGGSAGALSFQPANAYDTVVIMYPVVAGISTTLNIANGNGALGTINQSGANNFTSTTYTTALGSSPVTATNADGAHQAYINGIYTYNSASPGAIIFQAGWLGAKASDIINTFNSIGSLNGLEYLAPDLTIIEEYLNDIFAPTAVATYQANLTTAITAAQISGDVLVVTGFPSSNANWTANISAYVAAQQAACAAAGVNLIDMRAWFGATWAAANAFGLTYDTAHPNKQGHGLYGWAIASALLQVI